MARQHSLDLLVEQVAEYMEDTADFLAAAMLEDGLAPFEARVSEQERLSYFRNLLFNPDGTPNVEGRQLLMDQHGLEEYVRIYRWVEARLNKELQGMTRRERTAEQEYGDAAD